MTDRHRISAGAIVVHESRVLMVRCRKLGAYDFRVCPGGGVKEAETLEAAAAREVMEENGVTAMAAPSSRYSCSIGSLQTYRRAYWRWFAFPCAGWISGEPISGPT